jgi:putative hydrolase of the HAD superfamily
VSRIRLVSFDVWDTLLSVRAYYKSIASELAKLTNASPSILEDKLIEGYRRVRAIRRAGGFNDSEIVSSSLKVIAEFLNIAQETVAKAILEATENISPESLLIEGARETVQRIKEFRLKIVVVGNVVFWSGSYNRVLLERTSLSKFIDEQFYADELGVSKPKPEIFAKAFSKVGVQPEEALHVGDSVFEDLVGAVLAHMGAVLIDKNVGEAVRLSSWNAYVIPDIRVLEQVVKELEKH